MNKKIKKLWRNWKREGFIKKYLILLSTFAVAAINYNVFLRPLKIVAGGTNGLSIIVEELFSISPSLFILLFSIAILIIGYFTVGWDKASSAFLATFIYPLFIDLTKDVCSLIVIDPSDIIIACCFSALLSGWVSGITCKIGLSQGGITLINQIIYEKFKISISKSNFIINFIIVLAGGYCFGVTTVLCAILFLYINSKVIDKVMLGVSNHKLFYIVTEKEEIKRYLVEEVDSGITTFDAVGGKSDKNQSVIMAVIPNYLYYSVTKRIKKIDSHAFFLTADSYQVVGGHNH